VHRLMCMSWSIAAAAVAQLGFECGWCGTCDSFCSNLSRWGSGERINVIVMTARYDVTVRT
jgi:hypothetical protein